MKRGTICRSSLRLMTDVLGAEDASAPVFVYLYGFILRGDGMHNFKELTEQLLKTYINSKSVDR